MLCKSLVYSSESISDDALLSVLNDLEKIREINKNYGVSGALLYCEQDKKKYFVQYIEGSKENIDQLYTNIEKDSRHKRVRLLYESSGAMRIFENWSMGYISSEKHDSSTIVASEEVVSDFIQMIERGSVEDVVELIKTMYQQEQLENS